MTNGWIDIRNADVILAMGGNPAENHPCGFKWVEEAKAHRKAKLIVVDPRFTRSASVAETDPVVISSDVIKERRPMRMVDTSHAGLKDRGWKSEMDRHNRLDGWNRPEGVCMRIAGGANG